MIDTNKKGIRIYQITFRCNLIFMWDSKEESGRGMFSHIVFFYLYNNGILFIL